MSYIDFQRLYTVVMAVKQRYRLKHHLTCCAIVLETLWISHINKYLLNRNMSDPLKRSQ